MCIRTPRFSYGTSETCVRHRVLHRQLSARRVGRVYRVGTRVGIPVGTRGGYTGYYPASCSRGANPDSEAGPEALQGLEWWSGCSGRVPGASGDHPCGARSALQASLSPPRADAASWPIRARFRLSYTKVSQNDEVSTKSTHKACHSPHFQNGLRNSPLEILRFPYFAAFSHKELMVPFERQVEVYCQNDEVSPGCTLPCHARRGRQIPPRVNTVAPLLI